MNKWQTISLVAEARKEINLAVILDDEGGVPSHAMHTAQQVLRDALMTYRFHPDHDSLVVLMQAQQDFDALVFDLECGAWEKQS